ncbi:NADAR family protein [Kitasatospora sp. NA04385]|uniref:NADAR family protein n=1 Tax=Kitasatospora sp. NA04385 TaxID=2742135 RepID=UPI001591980B|nr:NADAR family protein [Kitasatospora sp. NA04385]QKW23402.1 NADAR family protein [Kitasatospora sp. NA04385]
MIGNRITHRTADGVRVPGTWRHAFIRNGGHYFLTDLFVYADGLIDCWGLVTVEEFEEKLRTGWVATGFPEGGEASAHELADWKFGEPESWITPESLVAEVRDTIDRLNGRPDSTGRCLAAVEVFLADRTEENRSAARAAFLAIPETQRRYALGDMDSKDRPLRVLVAGPGGRTYLPFDGTVTQEAYDGALAYFAERARWTAERSERVPADGPATPHAPAVHLAQTFSAEPVDDPGRRGLRHDYPAPITVAGADYPSVAHAYWARSVADPEARHAIATARTAAAARTLAAGAPRRAGWEHARTAVMAELLRAKYDQHPELAEVLLATDDATVIYDDMDSLFWGDNAGRGRNWSGRLLELVRSELHARRTGTAGA